MHLLKNILQGLLLCFLFLTESKAQSSADPKVIDLSGRWQFQIDPDNVGLSENWNVEPLSDRLLLPGSMQEQGFGYDITPDTEWWTGKIGGLWRLAALYEAYRQPGNVKIYEWLQPKKHYLGAAWYARKVTIPERWKDKRIILFLERVHWKATVFVDDREVGSSFRLGTAQEFDLTKYLTPGKHRITLRIDNSRIIDLGGGAHSVSEQTQATWNGVIGKLELRPEDNIRVADVQVFPDIKEKKASINVVLKNNTEKAAKGNLKFYLHSYNTDHPQFFPELVEKVKIKPGTDSLRLTFKLGDRMQLWDEFNPTLYRLSINLEAKNFKDYEEITFGMREVTTNGRKILINGQPVHLRGSTDCAVFPIHGYPRMDVEWWRDLWVTYKEWGFNHVRFHSWCPPRAAFIAADEVGIYMQPEASEWTRVKNPDQMKFIRKESEAMFHQYGNYASFVMMAVGNELYADKNFMDELITGWKADPRRIYSGKINGRPVLDSFDFYGSRQSPNGKRIRYVSGWPPKPSSSWYYEFPPKTTHDYAEGVEGYPKPLISHETGQRSVYPDVINQPKKFTGYLQPAYLDIARDQLEARGMLHQVPDFIRASGAWQIELYKEEFEANLRTPGLAGFQMLSLMDFPGQSTAPVGVLDYFYEQKGYVTPASFRRFNNETVILARMPNRTYFSDESFSADLELYNYADEALEVQKVFCDVYDSRGRKVFSQQLSAEGFPIGRNIPVGKVEFDLAEFRAPEKYNLVISLDNQVSNDWDFWVYPSQLPEIKSSDVVISHAFDEATKKALNAGEKVLLLTKREELKDHLGPSFTSFYWTAFELHGGESSAAGLLTDPSHPVFDAFPTEYHSNWQWWELLTQASPMVLDDFHAKNPWPKDYQPLVQMIPSWKVNRKLAMLAEAKVGNGKLMICSMDIETDLDKRKVARQFRYSLLSYMNSTSFKPETEISHEMIKGVFNTTGNNNLTQLGAMISAKNNDADHLAALAIDGDQKTFWKAPANSDTSGKLYIDMKQRIKIKGIRFLGGTDKDQGISFSIYVSQDGENWTKVQSGSIEDSRKRQEILLDDDYYIRYIRLEGTTDNEQGMSVAEIDIIPSNALPFEG